MKIVIYFKKLGVILEKIAYESHFKLIYGREKSAQRRDGLGSQNGKFDRIKM